MTLSRKCPRKTQIYLDLIHQILYLFNSTLKIFFGIILGLCFYVCAVQKCNDKMQTCVKLHETHKHINTFTHHTFSRLMCATTVCTDCVLHFFLSMFHAVFGLLAVRAEGQPVVRDLPPVRLQQPPLAVLVLVRPPRSLEFKLRLRFLVRQYHLLLILHHVLSCPRINLSEQVLDGQWH